MARPVYKAPAAERFAATTPWVRFTCGFQPTTRPSNVSKMNKAGPLVPPSLTPKAPVAANVLATIPLGPNGGAIGNKPGTGQGMVAIPEEMQGISTISGTLVPSAV